MIKRIVTATVITLLALGAPLAGCGRATNNPLAAPLSFNEYGPGTLVDSAPMTDVDKSVSDIGAQATRVTYRSTSGVNGSATEVTGAVFVPAGKPPRGGWPIIAFAHGTSGVNRECSPSATSDLNGSITLISSYLQLGFAIAATDYQGLGGLGAHPYLDGRTAGFNLIDSVRALRAVSKVVSNRWGALGGSQGGGASWAADELASTYAPELNMVGAVSLAPLADMSGFVDEAVNGTMPLDQMGVYVWTLIGIERTHPDFNIDDYRHGVAKEKWSDLSGCRIDQQTARIQTLFELKPTDLAPSGPEAQQKLTAILKQMSVPQQKAAAPLLVMYGGVDTYVDAAWTRAAIARACKMGTRVAAIFQPDKGHGDLDPTEFSGWLMGRFDGLPAPTTC